jgi:TIR domain-containing protein
VQIESVQGGLPVSVVSRIGGLVLRGFRAVRRKPLIFLSYRHDDSTAVTGRICDRLHRSYGMKSVFLDFASIPYAKNFDETIRTALERCNVVLAVVGPNWTGPGSGTDDRHRIHEAGDYVRREVELALEMKVPVIPVLVGGAAMPKATSLPETLVRFCTGQAARVDDTIDFHQHMRRLIHRIDQILRDQFRWLSAAVRAVLITLAAAVGLLACARHGAGPAIRASLTGATAVAFVALWVYAARRRMLVLDLSPRFALIAGMLLATTLSAGPSAVLGMTNRTRTPDEEVLNSANELRTEFANARTALVKSGNADFAGVRAIAVSLLHYDGENGHGWYYQGEIARIQAPNYFSPGSCALEQPAGKLFSLALYETDFERYLDIEHDLPTSETGGALGAEACYQRAKGYCLQRTLWIKHLLAIDRYREAMAQPDPVDRASKLHHALTLAKATLAFHRPDDSGDGFTQCIETSHLIETAQQALAAAESAGRDVFQPTH